MPTFPAHIDPKRRPHNTHYDDRGRGRWVYRDRKAGREYRIGDRETTLAELWAAVDRVAAGGTDTFRKLSRLFQQTPLWESLAESTRRDYRLCHRAVCDKKTRSGAVLGDVPLAAWTPGAVRRYRDDRQHISKARAKKELAYIKRLFAWAVEYEYMPNNPAAPVNTRGLATAREHYVEDRDYMVALYALPANVAVMAHLALLTGRRRNDVVALQRSALTPEGVYFARESKTGKDCIVAWSPELRETVNIALEMARGSFYLFPRRDDKTRHYTLSALSSAWGDAMRSIKVDWFQRFQFKDLRAKHASDLEASGGDATENLDHSSRGLTVRHYIRRPKTVVSLR